MKYMIRWARHPRGHVRPAIPGRPVVRKTLLIYLIATLHHFSAPRQPINRDNYIAHCRKARVPSDLVKTWP